MTETFLGVDIGTSGCKAALFDEAGEVICAASESYPVYYPAPGRAEQEPDDWWRAVCLCLRGLWAQGADPKSVCAVGLDGQSWSAIPVDAQGKVLARTPIWMDTRAAETCRRWEARLGAEHIFAVSGNPFAPTYTLPKLLYWMEREPELVNNAAHILQSNSFIVYRLTGQISMDLSMTYGWQNFDQKKLRFDEALSREFGIPERFLTAPVPCDAVVGRVTAEAARLTGLAEGAPVVAGGLDAACGSLGAGVISAGQTQEQGGQAGGMSVCAESAISHPKLILSAHVIPDRWLLQGGSVGGGAVLKWFAERFGAAGPDGETVNSSDKRVFEYLSAEAEKSSAGSGGLVFLPYFAGERSPIWDERAKGVYFGLSFASERADMVRATMEGVAFSLRHNIETAKDAGAAITELRGVGGAANSRVWTQIKSDVTGIPVLIPDSDTATTRGAAMLAMVARGVYGDYESATGAMVKIKRRYEPNPEKTAIYNEYYEIYKQLYENTASNMARLHELNLKDVTI